MATAQAALTFIVAILMITELILAIKDYYDILGVPKDATERQIKKAFHKLAMKYHPDKNKSPHAETHFREIAEAYEILSDERRRREYNQLGHTAFFNGDNQDRHQKNAYQPFAYKFDDMFKDFDIYSQNRHARLNKRHYEERVRPHQDAHRRHFQGGFRAGLFDDMFDEMEKMFTFDRKRHGEDVHTKRTEGTFQGTAKQHCRTVTQRRGNMVTTYTDCTGS